MKQMKRRVKRISGLLLSVSMLLTMLPPAASAAGVTEQFNLPVGDTYYFDLSDQDLPGTVRSDLPDLTLHYVPFTYVGTINAYSLSPTGYLASDSAPVFDRSLFVAEQLVTNQTSWDGLNQKNLVFGRWYGANYALRSLSGGWSLRDGEARGGAPEKNEYDVIWDKDSTLIKSFSPDNNASYYSITQDRYHANPDYYTIRGGYGGLGQLTEPLGLITNAWGFDSRPQVGFRPALEVRKPAELGSDGLKAVTLNLGGGSLKGQSSIRIVSAGGQFTAPGSIGLTAPSGYTFDKWYTGADGAGTGYAAGATVPDTVTTLYARWYVPEQFNLAPGGTYYFDLSGQQVPGTVNPGVPDTTLHYVPFTYTGTINAYSLASSSSGAANASEKAVANNHSLFVADYNVSHSVSWNTLHANNLIFGKTFDTDYTLRSLSGGNKRSGTVGTPATNEWEQLLGKNAAWLKNSVNNLSWMQDTVSDANTKRMLRGGSPYFAGSGDQLATNAYYGFRPALEVRNPADLAADGLKPITLDLGGGSLGAESSVSIISVGGSFTAPSSIGLTAPSGQVFDKWYTGPGGTGASYAAGATVPDTATTLYAAWLVPQQFNLAPGDTYYFDLSGQNVPGIVNPDVPDNTLHYVPFTYAGTINAYSLDSSSAGIRDASDHATASNRSLFVADDVVSHSVSWAQLHANNLIFGRTFDTYYKLRSLSGGNDESVSVTPAGNEWDRIREQNPAWIKNSDDLDSIFSWVQDTQVDDPSYRAMRGFDFGYGVETAVADSAGFRPALEVLSDTLGADELRPVTLDFGGGNLDGASSIHIVSAGGHYTAPSGTGLTAPAGLSFAKWSTAPGGAATSYAAGATVPDTVTTLYANWSLTEQFNLTAGGTYYFDLSGQNVPGTVNPEVPDTALHYVPFTYAGTIHAYSLDGTRDGQANASDDAVASVRSLFVADYNVSHTVSWDTLNANFLIFGKSFDTRYKLRSLSGGSERLCCVTPATNEWDQILGKNAAWIRNSDDNASWMQDTYKSNDSKRVSRSVGGIWGTLEPAASGAGTGFRPALEVTDTALGADELHAIPLELGAGSVGGVSGIYIIAAGDYFTAPSSTGLTPPVHSHFVRWTRTNGLDTNYQPGDNLFYLNLNDSGLTAVWEYETPTIDIDYASEQLIGFEDGASYEIDGISVTPADGKLAVADYLGQTLSIVKKGNGSTTLDSTAQEVIVPSRPPTPTATGVDPTTIGGTGKIKDVTTAMAYKNAADVAWTDVTGTEIDDLPPGAYQVRLKATATDFSSAEQSLAIMALIPEKEATPTIGIDYANEQLTGFEAGAGYMIGSDPLTGPADGKLAAEDYLGQTLAIVKKGNGSSTVDSAAQEVIVPSRPDTPTAVGVDPTTIGGTGKITGVTAAMEYKPSAGGWADVTGTEIDSLPAGTYQVRVKATSTGFRSAEQSIAITGLNTYTVTIENGGTGASGDGIYGMNASVAIDAGNRNGYRFTGWTSADGVTFADASSPSTTFDMPAKNVIVYAQWTANPTYTVTYDGNGNTGGSVPSDNDLYLQGAIVHIEGNTGSLTRSGHTFAGWNTQADGKGTDYAAGSAYTMGTDNVTLYAQWTVNDGGSSGEDAVSSPSCEDKVISVTGKLTLSACRAGEVSLGNDVTIIIPAGASDKEMTITIEKVSDSQQLLTKGDLLASPVYEISKSVSENFKKQVTLIFAFGPSDLKDNQLPVVFYYDEAKREWAEIPGSKIEGNRIAVEVYHFTKFAVFAVDEAATVPAEPEINFSDIVGHWAEAYIKQAAGSAIVAGYPDGTFKPDRTVTRAEFTMMLVNTLKLQGAGATLTFTDTAKIGSWAYRAVAQAIQAGIVKGYEDGTFRPDAEITRAEMALMLANAAGLPIEANAATGFADDKDIPSWASSAVAAVKKFGLVEGRGSGVFAPDASTTRAEAATVLVRMLAQKN